MGSQYKIKPSKELMNDIDEILGTCKASKPTVATKGEEIVPSVEKVIDTDKAKAALRKKLKVLIGLLEENFLEMKKLLTNERTMPLDTFISGSIKALKESYEVENYGIMVVVLSVFITTTTGPKHMFELISKYIDILKDDPLKAIYASAISPFIDMLSLVNEINKIEDSKAGKK